MSKPSYKTCYEVSQRCPVSATTYGYYPDLSANAFFAAFFGVLLLLSLGIGIRTKTWTYTIALGIGTLGECLGYIGRVLMHKNPWNKGAFEAIGGGVAAGASGRDSSKLLDAGNGLIVAGIAFQVATMAVCGLLVLDFLIRFRRAKANKLENVEEKTQHQVDQRDRRKHTMFRMFCVAVALAYLTVLIRCIYRLPEMAPGWGNPLMRKELEFLLLDGMMIALAILALTAVHPGLFFSPMRFASKK
ncbi:hypothetical protein H2198_009121 [Neophaeococcomyces mojaviensis]|uniref:Uncharacterized protein n=1 Tax=Neophaeococcomyces mojaviensis TaxID=3383035 RepID=A0ACC2ZVL3_9EURO|nr:hypothetical protein H2198_009121 [Knufia sp. JES_112]